jgi:glycosyltransferase involved in cell wall biosynthesis
LRLVITFPHSLSAPGGGTYDCVQLARHLGRAGVEVVLLEVPNLGPSRFPRPRVPEDDSSRELAAELRKDSVEVISLAPHPAHYLLDGIPVRRAVKALLSERRIDAVLGWFSEILFLPGTLRSHRVVFAMVATASYALTFRIGGLISRPVRRLRNELFFARPLRQADVVFARSSFTRGEIVERCGVDPNKVRVVHPGVDPLFARARRSFSPQVSRLLFFGTLAAEKGLFDALEALGQVARRGQNDWTLRIAGWGNEERVRAVARQHGIGERIEIVGRLDHEELLRELEWAQLVASEVAAVPEVVEKGVTGWLVPPGRVDQLADSIVDSLQDPEKTYRTGLAGRDRMTRMFTWERAAEATRAGLEEAIARRR